MAPASFQAVGYDRGWESETPYIRIMQDWVINPFLAVTPDPANPEFLEEVVPEICSFTKFPRQFSQTLWVY